MNKVLDFKFKIKGTLLGTPLKIKGGINTLLRALSSAG